MNVVQGEGYSLIQLPIKSIPFYPLMAGMAEGDQVVERVGIINVIERTYGLNVMNVGRSMWWMAIFAASLTGIAIAYTRRSAHPRPVWSIVIGMSTTPSRIILALTIGVTAIQRAKVQARFSFPAIIRIVKFFLAIIANQNTKNPFSFWRRARRYHSGFAFGGVRIGFSNNSFCQSQRARLVMAFPRTKDAVFGFAGLTRRTLELFIANCTSDRGRFGKGCGTKTIRAFTAASGLPAML